LGPKEPCLKEDLGDQFSSRGPEGDQGTDLPEGGDPARELINLLNAENSLKKRGPRRR